MGIIGYYRDPTGRICPAYKPGDLREAHLNYEAMCQEDEIMETPTRTVDAEVDERTRTYMRVNGIADYRTARQKVLDAAPALKAAYSGVAVPVRAGPAREHTHADTAAGIKEQLRQLIKDRVETTPQEVLLGLLSDQSWREQIMPLLLELIQE